MCEGGSEVCHPAQLLQGIGDEDVQLVVVALEGELHAAFGELHVVEQSFCCHKDDHQQTGAKRNQEEENSLRISFKVC
jgi:hypothetical protein